MFKLFFNTKLPKIYDENKYIIPNVNKISIISNLFSRFFTKQNDTVRETNIAKLLLKNGVKKSNKKDGRPMNLI